jgi:hypothetical protein
MAAAGGMDKFFLVSIFHVIAVAPFLLYVGFNRSATPEWVYNVLMGLGILVLVYHGFKAVGRLAASSPVAWINLIHVGAVAPLMLWIGYNGKKTGRGPYDMLLLIAFAAFCFHLYKVIVMSQTFLTPLEA